MQHKFYAGIGSRQTPPLYLSLIAQWAGHLVERGYTLRSGGAFGADCAFENGCNKVNGPKQIFTAQHAMGRPDWRKHASQYHPAWSSLPAGAQLLHARNSAIVLGGSLLEPVNFVLCWTPGGRIAGGTGQALRIAEASGIPIFNFGEAPDVSKHLLDWLNNHA